MIAEYADTRHPELPPKRVKDLRALSRASTHGDFRPWGQQVLRRDFHRMLLRDDIVSIRAAACPAGVQVLAPTKEALLTFMRDRNVETRAPPEEVAEELGRVLRQIPLDAWRFRTQ